ncbi:mitochondrial ATPase inhibitor, IATP-domain-containing protein [Lophiotrema nucula]|uniref:ATPase inhibitor, mitochondrial n=1 Tax=Lophiotrema nucula TaxID=690887 RepID=A0A6A5YKM0_9PLEO|nr:mitochondrial ATPase inhibitor, IATP-domain-containing protein [Lophiotrema nucula]
MYRTNIVKAVRPLAARRFLSSTPRVMAGETGSGSSRPTGSQGGDAFTRRETAAEELYIRQEERAKLLAIKERLKQQRQHLDELEKHMYVDTGAHPKPSSGH